jgi:hypothetical protein
MMYSQVRTLFKRFPGDVDPDRMDVEIARRWRVYVNGSTAVTGWIGLNVILTYHTIIYSVADSVSGFSGTVTLGLHRAGSNANMPGELVKTTTRAGDGSFSFTWYDNTESLYISASDASNIVGRSQDSLAV